jgi:hypothetical protein
MKQTRAQLSGLCAEQQFQLEKIAEERSGGRLERRLGDGLGWLRVQESSKCDLR